MYNVEKFKERRRQLELPGSGLLSKLTHFRQRVSDSDTHSHSPHYGHTGTLTRSGQEHYGHTGTLTRYHKDTDRLYYGPLKNLQVFTIPWAIQIFREEKNYWSAVTNL